MFGQGVAAAYLGVSERTFEAQWRAGTLPEPLRLGRRLLWDRKLLDRWADQTSGLAGHPNFFGD